MDTNFSINISSPWLCTAWCNEIGSLTSLMHVTQVHPVTTENQSLHQAVVVSPYKCTPGVMIIEPGPSSVCQALINCSTVMAFVGLEANLLMSSYKNHLVMTVHLGAWFTFISVFVFSRFARTLHIFFYISHSFPHQKDGEFCQVWFILLLKWPLWRCHSWDGWGFTLGSSFFFFFSGKPQRCQLNK